MAVFPHRVCARAQERVGEYTMVRFVNHLALVAWGQEDSPPAPIHRYAKEWKKKG